MTGERPESQALVRVLAHRPESVRAWHERLGEATLETDASQIAALMAWLRDDAELGFETLCDLTAVDRLGREPRFEIVYHLRSPGQRLRLRVKAAVEWEIASVVGVWPAAAWLEREVFDLYGIRFAGHPDLRRILLPADFDGHPLRKDHPKLCPSDATLAGEPST
jgi:NADH-quinone oxidoreductase subunit C